MTYTEKILFHLAGEKKVVFLHFISFNGKQKGWKIAVKRIIRKQGKEGIFLFALKGFFYLNLHY